MKTLKAAALFGAMVMVSGVTAFTTYKMMEKQTVQTLADTYIFNNDGNAHSVGFAPAVNRSSVTENDFTMAAEKTVNAVVGVKNVAMVQQQPQYQSIDPFFDFFFGNRGYQQQPQQKAREGFGSGVIISSDGYIVTNNHVIDGADRLTVTLNDERQFEATLVGTDPSTDIALIKVDATDLPVVAFGESDNLKVGEWVLAVGNPFMLNSTVTAGIVSAKARQLGMGNGNQLGIESFIQTDAAVNPGNSGGALVNTAGELVGINTAIYSQTGNYAGYSFAVPSSIVSKVVADLRQYGQVQRAVMGIRIQNVSAELAEKEGLKVTSGVYVAEVMADGAADEAGMKQGDVITAIGKASVRNMGQMQGELARFAPGDQIQVTVDRMGKTEHLSVKLRNSQNNTEVVVKRDNLGATLKAATPAELKQYYGCQYGVLVKDLDKDGLLYAAGIRKDFLIIDVNDYRVNTPQDVEKIFRAMKNNQQDGTKKALFITGAYPNKRGELEYYVVKLK
ncbi:MAG: Do family serine endopeptidase [Bacteroidales bacterium]|nr:Do family serine endopeptidase [Candidatus Liminaster caballi]